MNMIMMTKPDGGRNVHNIAQHTMDPSKPKLNQK